MAKPKVWLASNSPRRKEMLSWTGWEVEAAAANIDESRHAGENPRGFVLRLAAEKASKSIPACMSDEIIIAADTVVVLDGDILGKPNGARAAFEMLAALRGRVHQVMTGIAVRVCAGTGILKDICRTHVRMRAYTDGEIQEYIASGDPFDKAGAYAIQNPDFDPSIDFGGCFASVMGLPLCHLERSLKKLDQYEPIGMAGICQNHLKYQCPITEKVMAGEDAG